MGTKFKLFTSKSIETEEAENAIEATKLIDIQVRHLRETYKTECLDVKQLQSVLNVGESNIYNWLKKCQSVRIIGRRKVVPIIVVANYLVTGNY